MKRTLVHEGLQVGAEGRVGRVRRTVKLSLAHMALGGLGVVLAAVLTTTGLLAYSNGNGPKNVLSTYRYDPVAERWISTVASEPASPNPDGSPVRGSHTIIINIDQNNPVKEVFIDEALVIDSTPTTSLLEIRGHDDVVGLTGHLNIGRLALIKVDAEELEINADVVTTTIENVVAQDDELHLDLNAVNVVRTAGGAASSLFLGVGRDEQVLRAKTADMPQVLEVRGRGLTDRETGLRVDHIRILGPSSGTGFVENITVVRSSVMGKIEVRDVDIRELVLKDISLDDNV